MIKLLGNTFKSNKSLETSTPIYASEFIEIPHLPALFNADSLGPSHCSGSSGDGVATQAESRFSKTKVLTVCHTSLIFGILSSVACFLNL